MVKFSEVQKSAREFSHGLNFHTCNFTVFIFYRFTVYPIMPASGPHNAQSDRSVLSRPSMDLVMWLLEALLASSPDKQIGSRLAAALAACAQLSALQASQRYAKYTKLH